MFQAKLEVSELAYLAHTLEVEQIWGIDNTLLFPDTPDAINQLLAKGLESLKAHGWLVPDEQGFMMKPQLWLLTAVMAHPTIMITCNRRVGEHGRQVVTYYLTDNYVLEQFFTSDERFVLTQLPSLDTAIQRLELGIGLPEQIISHQSLKVTLPLLQQLEQGITNNVIPTDISDDQRLYLQEALQNLKPYASLDIMMSINDRLQPTATTIFLQASNLTKWMLLENDNSFSLELMDRQEFRDALKTQLTKIPQ